jgi:hypothetical protein
VSPIYRYLFRSISISGPANSPTCPSKTLEHSGSNCSPVKIYFPAYHHYFYPLVVRAYVTRITVKSGAVHILLVLQVRKIKVAVVALEAIGDVTAAGKMLGS